MREGRLGRARRPGTNRRQYRIGSLDTARAASGPPGEAAGWRDLRSRTLSLLYPPSDEKGNPIPDAASAPPTDELPDIKAWLSSEFDSMVTEGVSRVLDLSGGDRVLQEYVRDLVLRE